jgi:hypothetical protein
LGTYELSFGYLRICFWVPTDFAFGYLLILLLGTYGLVFGHLRIFIWVPTYQNGISRNVWTRPGPQHKSTSCSRPIWCPSLSFSQDLDSFTVLFWMSPRGREDFGPSDWDKNGWHEMTKEGRKEGLTVNAGSNLRARAGPGRVGCKCKFTNRPGRM